MAASNETQQQRLLTIFSNGGIDRDAVLEKRCQLKKDKQENEAQLTRLNKLLERQINTQAAREKIEQYCKRVKANLNKCTLQGQKQALNALDVQILPAPERMKIRVAVPLDFITTARTSA